MHGRELDLVVATVVELRHLCECELVLADLAALFCLLRKKKHHSQSLRPARRKDIDSSNQRADGAAVGSRPMVRCPLNARCSQGLLCLVVVHLLLRVIAYCATSKRDFAGDE